MRKPNYRFERAERDRAKNARNDKKLPAAAEKGGAPGRGRRSRTDGGE